MQRGWAPSTALTERLDETASGAGRRDRIMERAAYGSVPGSFRHGRPRMRAPPQASHGRNGSSPKGSPWSVTGFGRRTDERLSPGPFNPSPSL